MHPRRWLHDPLQQGSTIPFLNPALVVKLILLPNVFNHFDRGRTDFSFVARVVVEDEIGRVISVAVLGGSGPTCDSRSEPRESQDAFFDSTARSSQGRMERWFSLW